MNCLCDWILKIFFNSPEMNCSVFFFMYFLWIAKKMNHFLRNFVLRETEYFAGSTGIHFLLSIEMFSDEETAGSLLCGFSFAFVWLTKSFAFNCNAWFSSWFSVCRSFSVLSKIYLSHQKILTHESALSLLRAIILIANPCAPCKQLFITSITSPILVFPWIHPLGCDDSSVCALRALHRLSPSGQERRTPG